MGTETSAKKLRQRKKEIEDYFKSWAHKNFQKGVKDATVYLYDDILVIIGVEVLTFTEISIIDDEYSKQVVQFTRKKVISKNYEVLKSNLELICGKKIRQYYTDINFEKNALCMAFIFDKEDPQ